MGYKQTNSETFFIKISKKDWETVNIGRRLTGRAIRPYENLMSDPFYNREYVSDILTMTKSDLKEAIGHEPTDEQIFLGWKMGLKEFKKIRYEPANLKDKDLLVRLELFRSLDKPNQIVAIPPPLPTDGRSAVPTRYYPPKDSEHR